MYIFLNFADVPHLGLYYNQIYYLFKEMEVKSVYMDLVEGVKKGKGVWKLESEAFKKPIEIKIGYDNHELKQFMDRISNLESLAELDKQKFIQLQKEDLNQDGEIGELRKELGGQEKAIQILDGALVKQSEEIKSLYKVIADLKTTVETLSGTIIHLQEQTSEIQKKITKQPRVFSDKTFISGHESVGLGMIDVPDGEYLVISKYVIGEHNEFVTNQNDVIFERVHVSGGYVPMYKLYGGTELDKPTATVYRDLVLIPC